MGDQAAEIFAAGEGCGEVYSLARYYPPEIDAQILTQLAYPDPLPPPLHVAHGSATVSVGRPAGS